MKKPISPHLTIYKFDMNALMSISHRISGIILFLGTVGILKILIILAFFPSIHPLTIWCLKTWLLQTLMIIYAFVLFYHSFNGIRHMLWDVGISFEKKQVQITGWIVMLLTIISTFLLWRAIYG